MSSRPNYLVGLTLFFLIATAGACLAGPEPGPTADPALVEMYRSAVLAMNAQPQPEFVAFTMTLASPDAVIYVQNDNGRVEIDLSLGHVRPPSDYSSVYRSTDALAAIEFPDGGRGLNRGGLFNPTWTAASFWMRYGLHSPISVATPEPSPSAPPEPISSSRTAEAPDEPAEDPAGAEPPTIGGATVFSVLNYRLTDSGLTNCPSGAPARRIHMVAYRDPDKHPLTEVSVDPTANRICAMSFQIHGGGVISYRGAIDLRFQTVGPYDLVTDGDVDLEAHALGIVRKHVTMTFTRKEFRFPPALPAAAFTAMTVPAPGASPRAMESSAPQ